MHWRWALTSRFFRYGELHLVLLALLAERPMHGYELMGELNERFSPRYRASAGGVYPALQSMASEGLIGEVTDSDPVAYAPTTAGIAALSRRSAALARIQERCGVQFGAVATVELTLSRIASAARDAARRGDHLAVQSVLERAIEDVEALNPRKETA